jgi:hypothetical protein
VTERIPKSRVVDPAEPPAGHGLRFEMLGDVIPPKPLVRVLDRVLGALDLAAFTAGVKAFEGEA